MVPVFKGRVEQGKLKLFDRDGFGIWVESLDGKDIEVIVQKPDKSRSTQANRYYWGVVLKLISDTTGHTDYELHDLFKTMFLRKRLEIDGKVYMTVRSTTRLTTKGMHDYLEAIKRWAASNLDLHIPEADQVKTDEHF